MKIKITYFQGGKVWDEVVHANNVQAGKKIGEARNLSIKIIAANPVP